jgi:hypothetical protein
MLLRILEAYRALGAGAGGEHVQNNRVIERVLGVSELPDLEPFFQRSPWADSKRPEIQAMARIVESVEPYLSRYPLLEGTGNFGSMDGDPPAGPWHSLCRLTPAGEAVLDGTIPNALLNGADASSRRLWGT